MVGLVLLWTIHLPCSIPVAHAGLPPRSALTPVLPLPLPTGAAMDACGSASAPQTSTRPTQVLCLPCIGPSSLSAVPLELASARAQASLRDPSGRLESKRQR